ncbi:MAG: ABC transporter ATP-binding protein [Acidobacteria bacterium]|nr:ABC transporter ATP-binding protein [Acidobacteriota bacterium]
MLEAINLSKTYISDGISYDALRAVDLKIGKGERAAITGRSGSGKSTLMHLLACLDEPTGGSVVLDGKDISNLSEREKNVLRNEKFGFVFQQFFLNGRETVLENVALPLRIRGWRESKIRSAAKAALASVELSDKAGKRAKDLSGGEKQRVCVARALVGEPQMIFADEPTGNLDSTTGKLLEEMLFQLNTARGIALVIVTHDPDLARRCGRVVNIKDGRIESDLDAWREIG